MRSVARIMKDCPEGDITGEDIRACTAFEGYVYAISGEGKAGNVGKGNVPAAANILFAGLGPILAASAVAAKMKLDIARTDLLEFRKCVP